jgi:hypothetical protein
VLATRYNGNSVRSPIVFAYSFLEFFLYLFCLDFRKINGRIKNFEKYTSGVVPHGGRIALLGGGAARRKDPAAMPHGVRSFFIFFSFSFLKHF